MALVSGTLLAIQQRISTKLLEMEATSREKAVTAQDAHLDMQELNWLSYIGGGLFARVKKTEDKRYYVLTYKQA